MCVLGGGRLYNNQSTHRVLYQFLPFNTMNTAGVNGHPKKCCRSNCPTIETVSFYYRVMSPKDAHGMVINVDPDQTAPLRAI